MAAWELVLKLGGLGANEQLDEEIDPAVFHDVESNLSKLIIQLYTMESFFQNALLRASIDQDETKLQSLGPYALCLRSLLYGASEEREDVPHGAYTAYRSFLIDERQLNDFRNLHKTKGKLSLRGFTSASLDEAHALSQMQYVSFIVEQQ